MACQEFGALVVCAPTSFTYRTVMHCSTCKQNRRMVVDLYEWYGPDIQCLACGEAWSDYERLPRPFQRGWRKEAIARALRKAERAGTRRQAYAALNRVMKVYH